MVDLKVHPFYLKQEEVEWVNKCIEEMSIEEKIGQLFFQVGLTTSKDGLDKILSKKPGGVMFRPQAKSEMKASHQYLQDNSKYPLLLAANIEAGADGLFHEGTKAGNNMLVAATNDSKFAYAQGQICMEESLAVGGNVAFAPVVDINYNFENPISNTRTYGDKIETILNMSREYTKGVQDSGGSVMVKHFPGDGCDGRDQHLVTTINNLSYSDWLNSYGKIYKENFEAGALGMMVGHIALPSYFKDNQIEVENANIPASLSYDLITNLARKELGFNGLIMTDATLMAGFGSNGKRRDLVPQAIAAGNDMFLFTKNMDEDFEFMLAGYHSGIISDKRLTEALTRILGLKAKLKLNVKEMQFRPVAEETVVKNQKIADEIADNAITLVKNEQSLLPLATTKKIGLFNFTQQGFDGKYFVYDTFKQSLQSLGYEVIDLDFGVGFENMPAFFKLSDMTLEETASLADTFIYVTEYLPASNKTSIRINYRSFAGLDAPWFVDEVPTMYVSFGSPYHGYDFANIQTGINSYFNSKHAIEATARKIKDGEFKGTSPVNLDFKPFEGKI